MLYMWILEAWREGHTQKAIGLTMVAGVLIYVRILMSVRGYDTYANLY
jgi:hypothetical protein